jgi:hypothetical protein
MINQENDAFSEILEIFDRQKLNNIPARRTAYKPLYDYFQKLLMEIEVEFFNLKQETLQTYQLNTRWAIIKDNLIYIEEPNFIEESKNWDKLIQDIYNIRNGVEHNDYYDPKKDKLEDIRLKAPDFTKWLVRAAKEYYKISTNFTFKQSFYIMSNRYLYEAEGIFEEYGDIPPYVLNSDYSIELGNSPYQQLSELVIGLRERIKKKLEDVERDDLEKLIQLVKIIYNFKGKEQVLRQFYICPRCGGKIKETESYYGGNTEEKPEPDGIHIRVGCQNCDYSIDDKFIYL